MITIVRPSPRTVRRIARRTAPASAPIPTAAMRKPSVCAPPCSRSAAITGMSTVYGIPTSETIASRTSIERIGADPAA
jgi:hypothetical protein